MCIRYYICMLQVRENEISLRKWSGGAAHLRILEAKLSLAITVEGTLCWADNKEEWWQHTPLSESNIHSVHAWLSSVPE